MNDTTTERPRTLSEAQDRIDELLQAGDPVQLKAQLAARDAEIKLLKAAGSTTQQRTAPAATSPATSQPPATKPIDLDQMTLSELARAADEAGLAGDHAKANLYYQTYSARKQAGR
jgi:hypothetical protein